MPLEMAGATALGAGASFTGGLIGNILNYRVAKKNLAFQREANEQNIALQREINSQNIAFQQSENAITREREDNAVQRAAADMTAAGLSKTLAAGNPASAQSLQAPSANAPQVKALNNQFRYESALQKMNIASLLQDMVEKSEDIKMKKDYNDAIIDQIKAQTEGLSLQNSTFMENFRNEQNLKLSTIAVNSANERMHDAQAKLYQIEGDYKADLLQSEIDKNVSQKILNSSQTQVNVKQLDVMARAIAKSIAETNHLDKQTELLVEEITYQKLKIAGYAHDVNFANATGLPVGAMPGGDFGNLIMSTMAGSGLLNNALQNYFTNYSGGTFYRPTGQPMGNGGYAW